MKRGKPLRRTPIQRGEFVWARTPIKRTAGPARRTRVNPVNRDRSNPGDVSADVALAVRARSRDICERCTKRPATDMHHRVTRARGGPGDVFNLAHLCSECHHVYAHGENEWPWLVSGHFLRGAYVGPDEAYREHYSPVA